MSFPRLAAALILIALAAAASPCAAALDEHGLPTLTPSDVKRYSDLRRQGDAALAAEGGPSKAEKLYERALRIHEADAGLWYNLACARARLGETSDALHALDRAGQLGWRDARWPNEDPDLESLRELPAFQDWLASIAAAPEPECPTPAVETLASTPEEIEAGHQAWVARMKAVSAVLGGAGLQEARSRHAAWQAASWDRVAASSTDPEVRAGAELNALRAVAGDDAKYLSKAAASATLERAWALHEGHPGSQAADEAALLAAQARLALASRASGKDETEAALKSYERSLLLMTSTMGDGPALETALIELIGMQEDDPAASRLLYGRLQDEVEDADALRKRMLGDSATAAAYYAIEGLPKFEATTLDGRKISRDTLEGRVTLLDFWATWCGPCRAEMPTVKKAVDAYRDRGFEVIGISLDNEADKDAAEFQAWCKENGITWAQIYDGKGWKTPLAQEFGVNGIPFPLLVDRDGNVVAAGGAARGERLLESIARVLGPAPEAVASAGGQ